MFIVHNSGPCCCENIGPSCSKNFTQSHHDRKVLLGKFIISYYYRNTNKIPIELLCKNMISSCMKITFLHT